MTFIKVQNHLIDLEKVTCVRFVEPWIDSPKQCWKIIVDFQPGLTMEIKFYNDLEAKDCFTLFENALIKEEQ